MNDGAPQHHHPIEDLRHARAEVRHAALEAEVATGRHELTEDQARRGVIYRTLRSVGGFLVIGVGIALLPLPGPGWLVVILGLSMLPYAWARRTILLIRRTIPGIPEEGRIPMSTWIIMATMIAAGTAISILFGAQIGEWLGDAWSGLWD